MTPGDGGVNVAVVSRHGERVYFCLFDPAGEEELYRFALPQRLGDVHFGFVTGIAADDRYGLRVDGPWDEGQGHRFDVEKLLVDPYAGKIDRPFFHYPILARRGADTAAMVPKGIVEASEPAAAGLPYRQPKFVYEIAVKAFSKRNPAIAEPLRGTIAALSEPPLLAHFKRLGIDTIELMPLAAWIDERHLPALGLANAWGYNPVSFMAPDPRIAPGGFGEIRKTVATLHEAGIRVVVDAVFNHTGESDEAGATLSLRGLDNALYFRHRDGRLVNDSGCGNTLALERAPVVRLVMDAMRRWVQRTGIDGFRFDLATIMGRNGQTFSADSPLLAAIEQDPLLSGLAMIAEPWDAGGDGYRLGAFPARWQEWNDRYRDDVRRFWRGDSGTAAQLATRLAGSSDVFAPHRPPSRSINFLAAHDGFTLKDAVTYAAKDNHANGEANRDGKADEVSWPGGDVRALLATLFLSRGTPMLTAGDEFGRSQRGNNNAYAQDNDITWLDWNLADQSLIDFTAGLVALRKVYPAIAADGFLAPQSTEWIDARGEAFSWHDSSARLIGLVIGEAEPRLAVWINGSADAASFPAAPRRDGFRWSRAFCSAEGDGLPPRSVSLLIEERCRQAGIRDHTLETLAAVAGIERDWWEVDGTHHVVTPDSLRAMLAAMAIPHRTPEEVETSFAALKTEASTLVVPAGQPLRLGPGHHRRLRLHVGLDDGQSLDLDFAPGRQLVIPPLPAGRHEIRFDDRPGHVRFVLVDPGACHLPPSIAAGRRDFGLSGHLYALRHEGDGGIGDFETLRRFARITTACGGHLSGINPLHHMFPADRSRASPYQPSDRRFVDPIYISIATLLDDLPVPKAQALASASRAAFAALEGLSFVDYEAVWKAKDAVLRQAFAEFPGSSDFESFIAIGGEALARHGQFEAQVAGEPPGSPQGERYRAFLQWVADRQLARAAAAGAIYRDLALGSAFDGGEVWDAPSNFAAGVSLGAPPDPFARHGQVWNLPPLSPLALMARGLQPVRDVLAANMCHAAALRIDHVLGYARQFWVPKGAEGSDGAYVRFPAAALIALTAIESHRASCMVIGEDLGTIPEGLQAALAQANILSYRVLWFERDGSAFKPAASYPRLALACLASHDLPTFFGWRQGRDIAIERELGLATPAEAERRGATRREEIEALDRMTGAISPEPAEAAAAAHGFVAVTPSALMLVQADDLGGETEPLNVPGTDRERPNWRRRMARPIETVIEEPLAQRILARVRQERPQ